MVKLVSRMSEKTTKMCKRVRPLSETELPLTTRCKQKRITEEGESLMKQGLRSNKRRRGKGEEEKEKKVMKG